MDSGHFPATRLRDSCPVPRHAVEGLLASGLGARPEVFSLGPLTDLVGFRAGFVLVALATTAGPVGKGG